jgi:hypothetical protein
VGEAQELARRGGAVGVDEADEVGVGAFEGLGDHAPLAELGVRERVHTRVLPLVGVDDLRRAVGARVERAEEPDVVVRAGGAIRTQGAVDPVLLVVRWHHDVETHSDLPGLGRCLRYWPCAPGQAGADGGYVARRWTRGEWCPKASQCSTDERANVALV